MGSSFERASSPARARVAVVDDDPFLVGSLSRLLRQEGYEVVSFTCPLEAAAALEAQLDQGLDLVVTDHWMPALTGVQLATRLDQAARELGVRPPAIIALTGDLRSVRSVGPSVFAVMLEKPCEPEVLLWRVAGQVRARRRGGRTPESGLRLTRRRR